jgi:hypothetical protein
MREPEYAWWTTAAAQELSQRPERLLLCLDSRGENWGGYTSYVCSRQLAGLQGATADTTKIWTAAQLCQVTSAQIAGFADTFWDNVTLIVTDNSRLVSSVDCDGFGWAGPNLPRNSKYPIGYLSTVNWKSVRVVDRDGREVVKSFDYLRNETGFSDEIVNALEKSLQRDPVS